MTTAAGGVRDDITRRDASDDEHQQQLGRLEVRVCLQDIQNFRPTFTNSSELKREDDDERFPLSYASLAKENMPARAFIGSHFAETWSPLPDTPSASTTGKGDAVLAVQANFIPGGVIIAIYLHHSVGGVHALGSLMRCMSVGEDVLPHREEMMSLSELREEAMEQGRVRDRLSGSRGARADWDGHPVYRNKKEEKKKKSFPAQSNAGIPTCRMLRFSLEMLDMVQDVANEHSALLQYNTTTTTPTTTTARLSRFDCLISLLWKALTRARWPPGVPIPGPRTSALVIPINIRARVEPPFNAAYYGNSEIYSSVESNLVRLGLPFDVSTIGNTAQIFRKSCVTFSSAEGRLRSAIAMINQCEDVRNLTTRDIDVARDVFITNWTDVPVGAESTLGLGLGAAEWSRKLSRSHNELECVLMPWRCHEDYCEVLVQLAQAEEMQRLVDDAGLRPFLV